MRRVRVGRVADVAEAFARGVPDGPNQSHGGTLYVSNGVIYSYGQHWPIAGYGDTGWWLNTSRYSATTSRHTGRVADALARAERVVAHVSLDEARRRAARGGVPPCDW